MGAILERYRSFLRPTRRVSDMFLLAFLITFLLLVAGELVGLVMLRFAGFPDQMTIEELALVAQGEATTQEIVGAPPYLAFASMYLASIGSWAVFALAMAIPPANRRMLKKLLFVHDKASALRTGAGALMGFGINSACVLLSVALGDIQLRLARFELGPFLLLLFAVFIQSGAEEIVCRLFLYQKLARRYRHPAVAIVLSTGFFAALHAFNPGLTWVGVAQLAAVGLLLSILVCYFDSLGACVAMHTAWNFTQSILYGLPNSGIGSIYSVFELGKASAGPFFDPGFGVEGSLGALLFLCLASVGLVVYAKRQGLQPQDLWAENAAEVAQAR